MIWYTLCSAQQLVDQEVLWNIMHGPYDITKKKFNLSVVEFESLRWLLLRNATASTSFMYVVNEVCTDKW